MSEHTKEPWTFRNSPGAGLEILANVGQLDFCEYKSTGAGPIMVFGLPDKSPTVLIAYERWVQFEPKGWSEMQAANAARIVACVNALAGIPTDKLAAHVAAVARLREVDNRIPWVIHELRRSAKEGFNFNATELNTLANVLAAALAAMEGSK